jgi:glycosyltransferase involved in cell wall biosynthesis
MARPLWLAATVADRLPSVAYSYRYDLSLLHREMVSTLVTLEPFTRRPRVLDVDDAVWLHQRGARNFPVLAKICDGVVCGNDFLADNVQQWNKNILVLPTAVDTEQFYPLERPLPGAKRIIGWSGVFSNLNYLYGIERALAAVLDKHKDVVLRVVSGMQPKFQLIDNSRVEYIPWSVANDVRTIQEMSIGLMPIEDSLWGRGKCSYKMLLYMSCGLPTVVSPVGMNNEVLSRGKIGFGARSEGDWIDCLSWLLDHPAEAEAMGKSGRDVVEEHYSLHALAPRLAGYLKSFAR